MSQAFLKCDAPGCDHIEPVAAISPDLIGLPCPKCGASLLTEKDCADWLRAIQPGIDALKALGLLADAPVEGQETWKLCVHLHEESLTVRPQKAGETP